jgi:hypothetical protein
MTEETPLRPRAEFDGTEPEYVADDLADCRELLERAAEYAAAHGDATIAAELRRGAAVVDSEVSNAE